MKLKVFICIVSCVAVKLAVAAVPDPVADYINRQRGGSNFVTFRIGPYYSTDRIFRFDVDLNGDGQKEVLISSTLERDGRQGNVFHAYEQTADGFEDVGAMTISPAGFYLGPIDEINQFGVVKFSPGGGGEGSYTAYIFDGARVSEIPLGSIERNQQTGGLDGQGIELAAKYEIFPSDAIRDPVEAFRMKHKMKEIDASRFVAEAHTIDATELAEKYGIKVEAKTYEQALRDGFPSPIPTGALATPIATPSPTTSVVEATPAQIEQRTAASTASSTSAPKRPVSSLPIIIIVVVVVGVVAFLLMRKRP